MGNQHTRTDLAQAIVDHEKGLLTNTGLVAYFFRIKLASGQNRFSPESICKELAISKSSFYKALAKLKTDGEIDFETRGELSITNTNPNSRKRL